MSSVPTTSVVQPPQVPLQPQGSQPQLNVSDPMAMVNFLMASGLITPAALANAVSAQNGPQGNQPNAMNGTLPGASQINQDASQPGAYASGMSAGVQLGEQSEETSQRSDEPVSATLTMSAYVFVAA